MTLDNHIAELSRRHRELDAELEKLTGSPSSSSEEVAELKRRKLKLKDEIRRLEDQRGDAQNRVGS